MERELEYLWAAIFEDGKVIIQPGDDKYSKHDPGSEYNPSSFRDVLDYSEISQLMTFGLYDRNDHMKSVRLHLYDGSFNNENGFKFSLERSGEEITDRQLIYFRTMQANLQTGEQKCLSYNIGYKGKDKATGKIVEKVITLYE